MSSPVQAQVLTTLIEFNQINGGDPQGTLIQGPDGDFYGTTRFVGRPDCEHGCGTVFRITSTGVGTSVYRFCPNAGCTDGFWPSGGLILSIDGNFYGTTVLGGASGSGTVFKITPSG